MEHTDAQYKNNSILPKNDKFTINYKNLNNIVNEFDREIKKTKVNTKKIKVLMKSLWIKLIPLTLIIVSLLGFFGLKKIRPAKITNLTIDKLWQYKTLASIFSTPTIVDINNDKVNDILLNWIDDKLYCIDGLTGKRLFFFETEQPILSSPIILKKSKKKKWIILAGGDKKVYAIDGDNHCIWSTIRQDLDSTIISTPVLSKINKDKIHDVIVAAKDGKIYAFDGNRGWLIWKTQETTGEFFSTPLLIKINNDKILDIIIGSPAQKIYGIDGKTGLKIWEISNCGNIYSSPVYFNNDIVFIGDENGILYKINTQSGNIIDKICLEASIISTPTIINKNSRALIVVPLINGTIKSINPQDFNIVWTYNTEYQDPFTASPAVFDFNKDNFEDIIITGRNGYLYIIDGNQGENLVEPYFTGNSISSSPVLADINNDAFLDVVFGSENGYILAFTIKTVPDKIIKQNKIVYGTFLNR